MSMLGPSSCLYRATEKLLHQHKGQQPRAERPTHAECPSRLLTSLSRAVLLPATSASHRGALASAVSAMGDSKPEAAAISHPEFEPTLAMRERVAQQPGDPVLRLDRRQAVRDSDKRPQS